MHCYRGKMDRWDVVTEALATQGGGLQANTFLEMLGPRYIADAFGIARAADSNAKLFLNENLVETLPNKRQELFDMVFSPVTDDVPINGVALQMHITEVAPAPGVLTEIVSSYHALGLEVSIAEMDVHTLNTTLQTDIYGAVISEALGQESRKSASGASRTSKRAPGSPARSHGCSMRLTSRRVPSMPLMLHWKTSAAYQSELKWGCEASSERGRSRCCVCGYGVSKGHRCQEQRLRTGEPSWEPLGDNARI